MKIPGPGKGDEPKKPKEGSGLPGADPEAQKSAHALPEAFKAQAQPPKPSELKAFVPLWKPNTPSPNKRDPLGLDVCNKTHNLGLEGSFNPGTVVNLAEANGWWKGQAKLETERPDPDLADPNTLAKMFHKEWDPVTVPKVMHGSAVIVDYMLMLHIPMEQWPKGLADFYQDYKNIPEFDEGDFL